MVCVIAFPGHVQGVAILGRELPVLDQGTAVHCGIQEQFLAIHLNCIIVQSFILAGNFGLLNLSEEPCALSIHGRVLLSAWLARTSSWAADCKEDMALTAELGSQVLDANDSGMFSIQDGKACDVCGIIRSSPSKLRAYLPRKQTVELKMVPATIYTPNASTQPRDKIMLTQVVYSADMHAAAFSTPCANLEFRN